MPTYLPTYPPIPTAYLPTYLPNLNTERTYLTARKLVLDVGVGDDDDEIRVGQGHGLRLLATAVQEHRVPFVVYVFGRK